MPIVSTNIALPSEPTSAEINGAVPRSTIQGHVSRATAGSAVPAPIMLLRPELSATLHQLDRKPFYVIEDPVFGRFFRIGTEEWRFACHLNGQRSLQEAYLLFRASTSTTGLLPQRVEPLCRWLIQNGLVRRADSFGEPTTQVTMPTQGMLALNPFFIKIPLIRPDRLLRRLLPWCEWMMSWPCFVVWLFICGWGLESILSDFSRFVETARTFLAPHTWVYLWITWLLLKVIHETAHGLVCKKYGGFVGDSGAALILFSPVAYVDVTSAWRIRNRWHRVFISAAGIYVEFAIAAVAAIIWSRTQSITLSYTCHAVIMAATLTTILFNGNPLMRFDGYYILSDALNTQNLYADGRRYMQSLGSLLFLGRSAPVVLPSGWRRNLTRTYGVAAAFWRVVVCVSMVICAGSLFHGAGLVVAAIGVLMWLIVPLMKLGKAVMGKSPDKIASRRRLLKSVSMLGIGLTAIALTPWPGGMRAPAVVAYEPLENLRAQTAGFVVSVHVKPRQEVTAGTLLITLKNDDLRVELRQVTCELEQARIRAQTLNRRREIGQYQAELEQVKALEQRRNHLDRQYADLEIRSPIDGRVVDDDLETLVGLHVEVGTMLLRVASEDHKEIQVAIPESFVESFLDYIGHSPRVAIQGDSRSSRLGELTKVEPRATVTLWHPALGAHNGGPLPVEAGGDDQQSNQEMRLVSPRFQGTIRLPVDEASRLRDGQLGSVTIYDRHETVARKVVRGVSNWVKNKIVLSGY